MKPKIILTTILILFVYQTYSQETIIKGKVVDYETGDPIFAATILSRISDINGGSTNESGAISDKDGKFEFKGNPELIEINFIGYHRLIVINIPKPKKEIDLGEIKLLRDHVTDHAVIGGPPSELYDYEKQKKQDEELKKEVDNSYRIEIFGKKLKPYFEGSTLIVDCDKIE